jgi:hypothetical protein
MSEEAVKSLRETLAEGLSEAPWSMLEAHAQRDAVILVSADLELLDVAVALAKDDGAAVTTWMSQGLLSKPDAVAITTYEADGARRWPFVIVAPFVLVHERRPAT